MIEVCVPFGAVVHRFYRTRWDRPSRSKALPPTESEAALEAIARLRTPDIGRSEVDRLFDGYELVVPGSFGVFTITTPGPFTGRRAICFPRFIAALRANLADMSADEADTREIGAHVLEAAATAQRHKLALRFAY